MKLYQLWYGIREDLRNGTSVRILSLIQLKRQRKKSEGWKKKDNKYIVVSLFCMHVSNAYSFLFCPSRQAKWIDLTGDKTAKWYFGWSELPRVATRNGLSFLHSWVRNIYEQLLYSAVYASFMLKIMVCSFSKEIKNKKMHSRRKRTTLFFIFAVYMHNFIFHLTLEWITAP